MCAAAAADPTIGVNAMIAALALDGSDPRPSAVTVYNAMDHGWVARRMVPEQGSGITFPALAVFVSQPARLDEVHTVVRDAHYPVAYAYVTLNSDSAKGNRDAAYTMRALLRTLRLFHAPTPTGAGLRQHNGIGIIPPNGPDATTQPPVYETWGSAIVTAVTQVEYLVRDTSP